MANQLTAMDTTRNSPQSRVISLVAQKRLEREAGVSDGEPFAFRGTQTR